MPISDQPSFGALFRAEVSDGLKRGFGRVIPWLAMLCTAFGAVVAWQADADLFTTEQWSTLAAIYGGILTFNGITLALTWAAISRVYDTVSKAEFSRFLRASGLLNTYLFYISLIHVVQVISAVCAVLGLVSLFLPLPAFVDRVIIGVVIAATLYAIRWAAGSARVVKDLAWHYATFDDLSPEERHRLYSVAAAAA